MARIDLKAATLEPRDVGEIEESEEQPEKEEEAGLAVDLGSEESARLLEFFKEKKLLRSQIEGFIQYQKGSPGFSSRPEIAVLFKYVSFADAYRDFLKLLKQRSFTSPEFSFQKRVAKRSMSFAPDEIADIDYGLRSYEETGLKFEVAAENK